MTKEICTTEEQYATACRTSDLKVVADKGGAGDLMISAGWSPARLGLALMRLQTKADRAGLEQVHMQIAIQAARWNIERPEAVAAAVLAWWLHKTCGLCRGVKFSLIAGTPVLSTKACKACRGMGDKPLPCGEPGKRVARFIDECVERGQASIKKRLHALR